MTRSVAVEGVSKTRGEDGDRTRVLDDVSLAVEPNEFVVVVGPSGCGKTTLLEIIAGIEAPTAGTVRLDGTALDGPSTDVAMVFQDFRLLPWKTVLENVTLGLTVQGADDAQTREAIAREWLRKVGLDGEDDRHPAELSGGMRQRVGLARALAVDPEVLLMDEPFGSLDAQTRHALQAELLELWAEQRKTIVFVTHDVREAAFLADRIAVISEKPASVVGETTVDIDRPRWNRRLAVERSDEFARVVEFVRKQLGLAPA
ncbi:MAG: ABC transporter ATP-binding protein [Halobacteriales archaeon]